MTKEEIFEQAKQEHARMQQALDELKILHQKESAHATGKQLPHFKPQL